MNAIGRKVREWHGKTYSRFYSVWENMHSRCYNPKTRNYKGRYRLMILIGVCGYARAGKDTIANILVSEFGYYKLAFADKLREIAIAVDPYVQLNTNGDMYSRLTNVVSTLGWERAKAHPDVRRLLQRIGTEAGRDIIDKNLWLNLHYKEAAQHEYVVAPDTRFPNEEQYIRLNHGVLIRVHDPRKADNGVGTLHPSEQHVESMKADYFISNEGTIEELHEKVLEVMADVGS